MPTGYGSWPYRFAHVQDRREDLLSRMLVDSSKSFQNEVVLVRKRNLKNCGWQEIIGHVLTMSGPCLDGTNGPILLTSSHKAQQSTGQACGIRIPSISSRPEVYVPPHACRPRDHLRSRFLHKCGSPMDCHRARECQRLCQLQCFRFAFPNPAFWRV